MSLGKQFLSAVLHSGSVTEFVGHGKIRHLFRQHELPFFDFIAEFVKKHSKLPEEETVEAHVKDELTPATEPASYYLEMLQIRNTEAKLKEAMKNATEHLKPGQKDTDQALATMIDVCMELVSTKFNRQVVDFRHARDLIIGEYVKQYHEDESDRLYTGWPTLDEMSGGLSVGDVLSFVGRPAMGKTWQLLYAALHGWKPMTIMGKSKKQVIVPGQSRMFVSMEMGVIPIQQRLAALYASVPSGALDKAELSNIHYKKLKEGLTEIADFDAPFWVVDGNLTATVEDIWLLARQLKPHAIFIDGGYLLKHPTERDRYKRVAENADLIKSELAALAPTVCSWQFSRSAGKKNKKKGEKADLEDIGYTDAIGQVSSLVLAILQAESIETTNERLIDVLKGRKGETGSFRTKWRFDTMDFGEVEEIELEELDFSE